MICTKYLDVCLAHSAVLGCYNMHDLCTGAELHRAYLFQRASHTEAVPLTVWGVPWPASAAGSPLPAQQPGPQLCSPAHQLLVRIPNPAISAVFAPGLSKEHTPVPPVRY